MTSEQKRYLSKRVEQIKDDKISEVHVFYNHQISGLEFDISFYKLRNGKSHINFNEQILKWHFSGSSFYNRRSFDEIVEEFYDSSLREKTSKSIELKNRKIDNTRDEVIRRVLEDFKEVQDEIFLGDSEQALNMLKEMEEKVYTK